MNLKAFDIESLKKSTFTGVNEGNAGQKALLSKVVYNFTDCRLDKKGFHRKRVHRTKKNILWFGAKYVLLGWCLETIFTFELWSINF